MAQSDPKSIKMQTRTLTRGRGTGKVLNLSIRLQGIQRQVNGQQYCVLRQTGTGLPSNRRLVCVLDGAGSSTSSHAEIVTALFSEFFQTHLDQSLLPIVWNGNGDLQNAEVPLFEKFVHRVKGRQTPFSGVALPVRLGAEGNGYLIFTGHYLDISAELLVEIHGKCYQIMKDMLAADERRTNHNDNLSEREMVCLQMASDGHISEEIADRMGLSVHTVNAYLGTATTKLNSVNRIQAIAKALRLGYIN
ncbi:helix-turn-helix transcriptional regulator [Rhizobium sp. CFBP 8762]|uniref:transcriptional regulator VisR n=1 Tax=Rhizobium sp. CFBP 8762 TaxID=2775279 RepID=UPI00177AB73C|nr:helix-turn-helix transcriptional regulator [Rhizobium sp. CFBP 8762]MBD8553478.1 helix-turn-helix transcriptional regulator [Rhizobium sp. CFBP 8762]